MQAVFPQAVIFIPIFKEDDTMKIEKLPSGSYRIRKMYKGQAYQIVTDYKPTQKEAIQLMAEELDKVKTKRGRMTFRDAAGEYIESKRNILSPSTVVGYTKIMRQLSDGFLGKGIGDIDQMDIQKEINRAADGRSPKTVRNYHGFISAVLYTFRPEIKINTTLPQKAKNEPYIPSDEDVRRILECASGTEYEIPLVLACYGMRRSEICALTKEDIDEDVVNINKALVLDEHKNWVIKTTKTTSSTRKIVIPKWLADKIKKKGYVYKGNPDSITRFLYNTEKKLGVKKFSMHKLRHYFASRMSAMHIPDEDIMKMGGWQTDIVMKSVYRHAMQDEAMQAQREASRRLSEAIFKETP